MREILLVTVGFSLRIDMVSPEFCKNQEDSLLAYLTSQAGTNCVFRTKCSSFHIKSWRFLKLMGVFFRDFQKSN